MTFNLELISKEKANEQVKKLKNFINFEYRELSGKHQAFNAGCMFDGKTDYDIKKFEWLLRIGNTI